VKGTERMAKSAMCTRVKLNIKMNLQTRAEGEREYKQTSPEMDSAAEDKERLQRGCQR
jgi:hypothetical protein